MGILLVVRHGDRTTRHELREGDFTLGRDSSCELSFTDENLSRHHARIAVSRDAVRLSDLGSSNGSWVNGERVTERDLTTEDELRVGQLRITLEPLPTAAADSTPSNPVHRRRPLHLVRSGRPSEVLAVESPGAASAWDREETLPLGLSPFVPPADETLPPYPTLSRLPAWMASLVGRTMSWSWASKFVVIVTGIGLVAYFALAVPMAHAMRSALKDESLLRARALLRYLAAANESLLAEQRLQELSLEALLREPGVKDVLILDLEGKVLAPSVRAGEILLQIEGIETTTPNIYTFYLGRTRVGDYNLVLPLTHHGRRIGLGVLTYSVAGVTGRGSVVVELILGFLIIAGATGAAVVAARRITMKPMVTLTEDVEAVVKTDAEFVPSTQPYRELEELAESINRLIDRTHESEASETPEPFGNADGPLLARKVVNAADVPTALPVTDPSPPPPLPSTPAAHEPVTESGDGYGLTLDESYVVTSVDDGTAAILRTSPDSLVGRHVLETVGDPVLLERILDLLNTVTAGAEITEQTQSELGPVELTVGRRGTDAFVRLHRSRETS